MYIPESKIEIKLVKRIKQLGGYCPKLIMVGKRNFPDRTILLSGGYIAFAECKGEGKELRKTQSWFSRKVLIPLGFKVYKVINEKDIEDIVNDYFKTSKNIQI